MIFEFMSVYSGQMPLVKLPFMLWKDVHLYEINSWWYRKRKIFTFISFAHLWINCQKTITYLVCNSNTVYVIHTEYNTLAEIIKIFFCKPTYLLQCSTIFPSNAFVMKNKNPIFCCHYYKICFPNSIESFYG